MAVLDDLVQFVSDNTLGGSWQKAQLHKRCEEFLEDGGIVAPTGTISITENGTVDVTQYASASVEVSGGGTPDRITVGMLETFDWPAVTVNVNQETGTMSIGGEDIENVLGISEGSTRKDCSLKFKIPDGINPPIVYAFDSFGESNRVIYHDTESGVTSMEISYLDAVVLIAEGEEPITLSYNSVNNVYVNGR